MGSIDNWKQIPPPEREIFNLKDIINQTNHFLNVAVRTGLISFALQVYQVPGEESCRYHFYFQLNEEVQFCDTNGQLASISGLALWMECQEPLVGELTVRFVIEDRKFFQALASFEFPLKDAGRPYNMNLKLLDIINILRGTARELPDNDRVNLTLFRFWPIGQATRGYRDALTQWMIRLNNIEYVGWWSFDESAEDTIVEDQSENDPFIDTYSFGHIIGQEYKTESHYDSTKPWVVIAVPKSVRRGVWVHRDFERVLRHQGVALPYEGPLAWAELEEDDGMDQTF